MSRGVGQGADRQFERLLTAAVRVDSTAKPILDVNPRHAMVTPVQVDRWGQGNLSALGPDFNKPKVQLLGVRGFPGNSVSHKNSMFLPNHSKRTFIEGEEIYRQE